VKLQETVAAIVVQHLELTDKNSQIITDVTRRENAAKYECCEVGLLLSSATWRTRAKFVVPRIVSYDSLSYCRPRLNGHLCIGCQRQSVRPSVVDYQSCSHISKTKQDRPIVTMEYSRKLAPLILLLHSEPLQTPRGAGRPLSCLAGCWLIQRGGCWNSQVHLVVEQMSFARRPGCCSILPVDLNAI